MFIYRHVEAHSVVEKLEEGDEEAEAQVKDGIRFWDAVPSRHGNKSVKCFHHLKK
jgi:hypothetical protein